jgi:hypothetical protein
MNATRDLIAAALTVRDVIQRGGVPEVYAAVKDLRELCARAMVQPNMAEVERLLNLYDTAWLFGRWKRRCDCCRHRTPTRRFRSTRFMRCWRPCRPTLELRRRRRAAGP